jgi:hypothetical protein
MIQWQYLDALSFPIGWIWQPPDRMPGIPDHHAPAGSAESEVSMPRHWRKRLLLLMLVGTALPLAAPAIMGHAAPPPAASVAASSSTETDQMGPAFGTHLGLPQDANHRAWASELGMDWIKVYDSADDWPFKVMLRVPANWEDFNNPAYCDEVKSYVNPHVDAYEIGNEPNLDWTWSEGTSKLRAANPFEYTEVLKTAYRCIKEVQPDALVIAAGMATTGPYSPTQPHPLHPAVWNDLMFIEKMYAYGAKGHFDALGTHPHGFAYSPAEAPNAANSGLVFRRAEQQRAIMVAHEDEDTPMWATEWGWLLKNEACEGEWQQEGRWWQTVDEVTQANYVRGAFEYATIYWPWMEVMFHFNLDFSTVGWYAPCEPMRYYAIVNPDGSPRQAYLTLRDMPRWPYATLMPGQIAMMLDADEMDASYTRRLHVDLVGNDPLTYSFASSAAWLVVPGGNHAGSGAHNLAIQTAGFDAGTVHDATVTVTVNTPVGTVQRTMTVRVYVVAEVTRLYLPLMLRGPGAGPPTPPPAPPPTPSPTPPPAPPGCTERIANGGFESTGDWVIPATVKTAGYSPALAHSGTRSMRAGIVAPDPPLHSYSSFQQTVTIPSNATSATLRFWLYPRSSGTTAQGGPTRPVPATVQRALHMGDAQYLLILNQSGAWIGTAFWERRSDNAWVSRQYDLMGYAGQTIKLHFGVYNNGYGGITSMHVDDVSLQVCAP